jgi:hypothetical protein
MFFNYDVLGLGEGETYLISGDSGAPSFACFNGELTLLGEHFSTYGTRGLNPYDGGPPKAGDGCWWSVDGFLPAYISQINSVLPTNQQLRVVFGLAAPRLAIKNPGDGITISWPLTADGFTLQQNTNAANASGRLPYDGPVSTNQGINSITISAPAGDQYYRLFHP